MSKLKFGQIVLLNFPFTDTIRKKKRPALVLNDFDDGDILVCRITSRIYTTAFDIPISDWENVGLKLSSVIRVHKLATLQKSMVESILEEINKKTQHHITQLISKIVQ